MDRQSVRLLVADARASYPVTIDPLIAVPEAKLTAADARRHDALGTSVSLDGDTAVVGGQLETNPAMAYVFVRSGSTWTQQAKLAAADAEGNAYFGSSVSLDRDLALVGAWGSSPYGAAYVFARSGETWSQQAKVVPVDTSTYPPHFGDAVSLSGDTALIGAPSDDDLGYNSGSAYVFARSGGVWLEEAKLTAADGAMWDEFGDSVSLSGDTALVGSPGHDVGGSVYVFVRSGGAWMQEAKLTPSDVRPYDEFGMSVSLAHETALIGAYRHDDPGSDSGAAYIFVRSAGAWVQQAESAGGAGDGLGRAVALGVDGTALVGAPGDDEIADNSGAVYVFRFELDDGSVCPGEYPCRSGNCVDGHCCDRACSGQCEACDVAGSLGVCVPVVGSPHGTRPACGGTGACAAACDGIGSTDCVYPGAEMPCAAGVCTDGMATPAATCDGTGECGEPAGAVPCAPYVCGTTACLDSCATGGDCASEYVCVGGACVRDGGGDADADAGADGAEDADGGTDADEDANDDGVGDGDADVSGDAGATADAPQDQEAGLDVVDSRDGDVVSADDALSGGGCGCRSASPHGSKDIGLAVLVALGLAVVARRRSSRRLR
ncbi:MAG: FG-GAP repeat protein [Deltaproteobacteria bacterium]|nr:FG-GAP repeat protein [Deltaproteobacteria bacterium]